MFKLEETIYVEKPWGFFHQFTHNEQSTVKVLTVNPDQQLSLQSHKKREEMWVFIDEGLIVEVDDKRVLSKPYHQIFIPKGSKHRATNNSMHTARILEISFSDFDENDVTRYEDKYGRV